MFVPSSNNWLTILRIGLALQIILYCFWRRTDWLQFAANNGALVSRELMERLITLDAAFVPNLGWIVGIGDHLGFGEQTVILVSWAVLLCSGFCLLAGIFCRTSAIISWFLYLCAMKSGNLFSYGTDALTTIGLFYLMLAPLPDSLTFDHKVWKSAVKDPHLHGFFRRLLQLHLCVIYFFGGLTKALGIGWWTGASMWRALTRTPFNVLPTSVVLSGRMLLPVIGIAVFLLELGYPVFIWPKNTRVIWLIGILSMHVAIGLAMGLYLFALVMIVLNLAAFGPEFLFRERLSGDSLSTEAADSISEIS